MRFKRKGTSLIEMMIFMFIFSIATITFYRAFTFGTTFILESKNRLAAIQVANEKMEIVRSLVYSNIGTRLPDGSGGWVYGIPRGDILAAENITKNTRTFYVCTSAMYKDDPLDRLATSSPVDAIPTDYKEVRVQVSWDNACNGCPANCGKSKSVYLTSRFVPPGMETIGVGGILAVNVQDNSGAPLDGVNVRLQNSTTGVDATYQTVAGNVMFFEVPQDTNAGYRITVSKAGLFGVQTYPAFNAATPGSFDPVDRDTSVTNGTMWTKTITTDQTANLEVQSKDLFGNFVSDVTFSLEGGRVMGATDDITIPPVPVYSYPLANLNSGAEGKVTITHASGISSGNYNLAPIAPIGYEFVKMATATSAIEKFSLAPGTNFAAVIQLAKTSDNAFWFKVTNKVDGTPLKNATVQVRNLSLPTPYDQTVQTDDFGNAIFTNGTNPLESVEYEVIVTMGGFQTITENKTVNALTKETFEMEAN